MIMLCLVDMHVKMCLMNMIIQVKNIILVLGWADLGIYFFIQIYYFQMSDDGSDKKN